MIEGRERRWSPGRSPGQDQGQVGDHDPGQDQGNENPSKTWLRSITTVSVFLYFKYKYLQTIR